MRKVALFAAIAMTAAFANTSAPAVAQDFFELNKNSFKLLQGPAGAAATTAAPAPAKTAKKGKKKK
ncbi:MAG: hypothetical protein NTV56_14470 [Alphaproteobacteria bacterium]|nr:hypothetical protein [Alphaproteobacteria bacterium]